MQYTSASIHDEHWKAERERKRRERSPKRSFEYFLFTWDCWVGLQRQHINDIELDSGREYRIQPPEPGLIVLHHDQEHGKASSKVIHDDVTSCGFKHKNKRVRECFHFCYSVLSGFSETCSRYGGVTDSGILSISNSNSLDHYEWAS